MLPKVRLNQMNKKINLQIIKFKINLLIIRMKFNLPLIKKMRLDAKASALLRFFLEIK